MKTLFVAFALIALVQFSVATEEVAKPAQEEQMWGFSAGGNFGGFGGGIGINGLQEQLKQMNPKEQEMFLGSLLGAAPGILNGVGNIIGAARGREQELGWGSLARAGIKAAPGILSGGADVIRAIKGRQEAALA